MAVDTRKVRVEEQLKIKIGEAKSLVGRSHGGGAVVPRDVYCTVALDQEEICRTSTMERTLNPFFGEEFQFEIPRKFRYLSVYVFDRDRHLKQDKVVGKVAIKREELHTYNHKDHWFAIRPVDADSEVQGMVHVEVSFDDGVCSVKRKSDFDNVSDSGSDFAVKTKDSDSRSRSPNTGSGSDCFRMGRGRNTDASLNDSSKENVYHVINPSSSGDISGSKDQDLIHRSESLRNSCSAVPSGRKNNTVGKKGSLSYTESLKSPNFFQKKSVILTLPNPKHSPVSARLDNTPNKDTLPLPLPPKPPLSLPTLAKSQFYTNASSFNLPSEPPPPVPQLNEGSGNKTFETVNPFKANPNNRVTVRVVECVDLTLKNGSCDPYAVLTAVYSNGKKVVKRTKVRKKTVSPTFDESFTFDLHTEVDKDNRDSNNAYTVCPLGESELCSVGLSLWHDAPGMGMGGAVFLGEVRIPLRGAMQQNAINCNAWYFLQPRSSQSRPARSCATPPGTRLSSDNTLGSLRLKVHYTADHVFPEQTYDTLKQILMKSLCVQPLSSSAVYLLGEIVSNKMDAAQPLVRLFTHHGQIANIIRVLADYEISKLTDATTIFRGNTLVSKMMDGAMRLWGLPYLHRTLRGVLEAVFTERKLCEIDPTRVKDPSTVAGNLENLKEYVEKVFQAITNSALHCPPVLCQIFQHLRHSACTHFPHHKEVRYSVVSGFIFLRFFAPAILGPRLFDLTNEQIDVQTNRTLTLISKTIQSLGNLVSSRSAQQLSKEQYTTSLYSAFCTEKHVGAVKRFLEVISLTGSAPDTVHHAPQGPGLQVHLVSSSGIGQILGKNVDIEDESVVLKEGMMIKRAQGRKRFGRKNFKERYFRLTTQSLSYSKSKGKAPLCTIPLTDILAVETLTEQSFKMKNMFQIVQAERALYVQTANCVELKEWVDLLNKVCHTNANRLQMYHPCAYINGHWLCCQNSSELALGCAAVSSGPSDLHMTLDPARDLQRLHSLIMMHLQRLQAIKAACECQVVGGADPSLLGPVVDDPQTCLQTSISLMEIALNLEDSHRTHLRAIARDTKYGSRQAPIGDDNYLHLAARAVDPAICRDMYMKESKKYDSIMKANDNFKLLDSRTHHELSFSSNGASPQEALRKVAISLKQSLEKENNSLSSKDTPLKEPQSKLIEYKIQLDNYHSNNHIFNNSNKEFINQSLNVNKKENFIIKKPEQNNDLISESDE